MANEPTMTVVGRIARTPELRFSKAGKAVVGFTVASTPRKFADGEWVDGPTLWMRCSAFGRLAEHIAESVDKGHPVIATGKITQNEWEDSDGNKRTSVEMLVDSCGHDLNWVTTVPHKPDAKKSAAPAERTTPDVKSDSLDDIPF